MRLPRPDAPQDLESAANRNNAARRSSRPLLDPHGIYGTRTAARQRAARRRQAVQSLTILSIIAGVTVGALWWAKGQRVPRLARLEIVDLGAQVAAPSAHGTIGKEDVLVVPREDGSLLLRWSRGQITWHGDFALRAAPLVAEGRVFAAAENGTVYGLDIAPNANPKMRWKSFAASSVSTTPTWFVAPVPAAVLPGATPVPAPPNLLIVADDDGTISALRADTGGQAWIQHLRAPAGLALALEQSGGLAGRVWVPLGAGSSGFEGGIACLEAQSGRILWKLETGAPVLPAPVVDSRNEHLYGVDDDGAVWALDARTGRKLWRRVLAPQVPGNGAIVLRAAVVLAAGGANLLVGGNDGVVHCLAAASGAELWRFDTGADVCRGMVVFNGSGGRELVACTADSDELWVLDVATGAPVRRAFTAGIPRSVVLEGDALETVSRNGWLERFTLPR